MKSLTLEIQMFLTQARKMILFSANVQLLEAKNLIEHKFEIWFLEEASDPGRRLYT